MLETVLTGCNVHDLTLAKKCLGEYDYIHPKIEEIQGSFEESSWKLVESYSVPLDCNCNKGKVTIPNNDTDTKYMIVLTGLGSHIRYYLGNGYDSNLVTEWKLPQCLSKIYSIDVYKAEKDNSGVLKGNNTTTEVATIASTGSFPYPLLGLPLLGLPFALSGSGSNDTPIPETNAFLEPIDKGDKEINNPDIIPDNPFIDTPLSPPKDTPTIDNPFNNPDREPPIDLVDSPNLDPNIPPTVPTPVDKDKPSEKVPLSDFILNTFPLFGGIMILFFRAIKRQLK